jgi:hypothetical protein
MIGNRNRFVMLLKLAGRSIQGVHHDSDGSHFGGILPVSIERIHQSHHPHG